MTENDFEQVLRDNVSKLEHEKLPQSDLWARIEPNLTAISDKSIESRTPIYSIAFAASIFLLVSALWMGKITIDNKNEQTLIAELEKMHQQQLGMLYVDYKDQRSLSNNWRQQIDELEKSERLILETLNNEPDNMALLKMLKNIYLQKLMLIERVHNPKWEYNYSLKPEVTL